MTVNLTIQTKISIDLKEMACRREMDTYRSSMLYEAWIKERKWRKKIAVNIYESWMVQQVIKTPRNGQEIQLEVKRGQRILCLECGGTARLKPLEFKHASKLLGDLCCRYARCLAPVRRVCVKGKMISAMARFMDMTYFCWPHDNILILPVHTANPGPRGSVLGEFRFEISLFSRVHIYGGRLSSLSTQTSEPMTILCWPSSVDQGPSLADHLKEWPLSPRASSLMAP